MRTLVAFSLAAFLLFQSSGVMADPAPATDVWALMADMRTESRADALTIKEVYAPLASSTMFEDREDLKRALASGELVLLDHPERFNVTPRVSGESYIGQQDLEHQNLYVSLRPAAMGMLFEIAKRVRDHGPLEVTSLVRSAEYQQLLMRGNGNANTDVPTHAMGYAIDIGVKQMPIDMANALRGVLEQMRAAGDIYFIGERNQLTFHVVPVPARFDHFARVYETERLAAEARATGAAPDGVPAIEPGPVPPPPAHEPSAIDRLWNWIADLVS